MIEGGFEIVPMASALNVINSALDRKFCSWVDLNRWLEGGHSWSRVENWEEMDDLVILNSFFDADNFPSQEITLISEASYKAGLGAFRLRIEDVEAFTMQHLGRFAECLFNGDVLIIGGALSAVWTFHHEGVWAFVPCERG
jgi:hypothetical protein